LQQGKSASVSQARLACFCIGQPTEETMNAQFAVKDLFHSLDFKVLSLQRIEMRQRWNIEQVSSPFSHLWFMVDGHATIKHHGRTFALQPGCSHLVPALRLYDCHGEDSLDCIQLHFRSKAATGVELFSVLNCSRQASELPDFKKLLHRPITGPPATRKA
jgi:hypothetical protein